MFRQPIAFQSQRTVDGFDTAGFTQAQAVAPFQADGVPFHQSGYFRNQVDGCSRYTERWLVHQEELLMINNSYRE